MTNKNFIRDDFNSPFNVAVFYDKFEGIGSEPPTENWWLPYGTIPLIIENNALNFTSSGASGEDGNAVSRFELKNDFDVQVDWDVTQPSVTTGSHYNRLSVYIDKTTANRVHISKQKTSSTETINVGCKINDVWQTSANFNTIQTSGKFRIFKSGTLVTAQYDIGSGWVTLDTHDFTLLGTSNANVRFECNSGDSIAIHNYSNFIINSADKMVWPGGTLKRWDVNSGEWVVIYMNRYSNSTWNDSILYNYSVNGWKYVGNV